MFTIFFFFFLSNGSKYARFPASAVVWQFLLSSCTLFARCLRNGTVQHGLYLNADQLCFRTLPHAGESVKDNRPMNKGMISIIV